MLTSFIIGCAIGYVGMQVAILFFGDEIFAFMDRLVYKVRKLFKLN